MQALLNVKYHLFQKHSHSRVGFQRNRRRIVRVVVLLIGWLWRLTKVGLLIVENLLRLILIKPELRRQIGPNERPEEISSGPIHF